MITDQDINDLVVGTLKDLGRMAFQQIAQELTDFEVFPIWFKKDKVTFDSGIGIQKTLMNRIPDVARHVGWAEVDNPKIEDLLTQMNIPWRSATTHWSYKRQEMLMNRGKSLVTNVIKARRAGSMISMVQLLENGGWTAPPDSSDTKEPFGIPYWITKNSSTGFYGGAPSGWSDVAGVNLTTTPTFKNYTGEYAEVSKADAIKMMRTMKRHTGFKSPVDVTDYRKGRGMRYRLYINEPTETAFEDVGESQNENLGRDIASIDGMSMAFRGFPLRYVPKLNDDTTDPIYFVDHSVFYPVCLAGDYLYEHDPIKDSDRHNWFTVYVDLTYNYICFDRRRCGVLSKAA